VQRLGAVVGHHEDGRLAVGMFEQSRGAENRDGSSGISLAAYPGDGATRLVTLGAPTPGGSGTTIAPQAITVTP